MKKYENPSLEVKKFSIEEDISVNTSKMDDGYVTSSEDKKGAEDLA